jgi:hypothetical protein
MSEYPSRRCYLLAQRTDPPGVEAGEAEPAHDFVDELIASTADRHHDASSGLSAGVAGPADADG